MDNGCGIFVKIVTNLWREEISTYQQIKKEDALNEHPLSIKQICF